MKEKLTDLQMAEKIAVKVDERGGRTFYVGGFVRDRILGKDNKDIDIEIHGITVDALEELLDEVGKRTEMGASFGVFGLRGYELDIAMPRKEEAIGRGHKDFKVDVDPFLGTYKAAIRRDFTMNALMQDVLTGKIVDHFGGLQDLKSGVLRHVNSSTFVEDPLRVLRAAQFAARFEFSIADETIRLSKTMDLSRLARERILGELEKALLKADRPSIFFEELRRMNQLSVWFPEIESTIGVMQNPKYHPEGDVWTHTMMTLDAAASLRDEAHEPLYFMLTALMHDLGKPETTTVETDGRIRSIGHETRLDTIEKALARITNEVKAIKYVRNMAFLHMRPNQMADAGSSQTKTNKMFDMSLDPSDLILFSKADRIGRKNPPSYAATETFLRERLQAYLELMKQPSVMGADLVAAGFKPGPQFSEIIRYAHDLHLEGVPKEQALAQTLAFYAQTDKKNNT